MKATNSSFIEMKWTNIVWVMLLYLSFSQARLILRGPAVSVPGANARFLCISSTGEIVPGIHWLVNETVTFTDPEHILVLTNLTVENNMTSISCRIMDAHFSPSHTLLLQGTLAGVGSPTLVGTKPIVLTWRAPFTLDIDGVDPDISGYCVDVVSSTSSDTLHSGCGINTTNYMYHLPPMNWCDGYDFVIVPVNVVGNGLPSVLHYSETTLPTAHEVNSRRSDDLIYYTAVMSAGVCRVEVLLEDLDNYFIAELRDTDVTISETNITFFTQHLNENRRYNVTIVASNIAGNATSYTRISTHDIKNLQLVTHDTVDELLLTASVEYSMHSRAAGVLIIIVLVTYSASIDFISLALNRTASQNYTLPFQLPPGRYRMSVYDIESDGTLATGVGYPAASTYFDTICMVQGTPFQQGFSDLVGCEVTASFAIVATCAYHRASMATGFQVVAHLINSSELHRLYANKTAGRQTSVIVQIEQNGLYHVTIFAIRGERGIVDAEVEYTDIVMVLIDGTILSSTASFVDHSTNHPTTIAMDSDREVPVSIFLGVGFVIVSLISVVLIIIVIIQCYKLKSFRTKPDRVQIPLEEVAKTVTMQDPSRAEGQVYEVIKEPDAQQSAAPKVEITIPLYEDVISVKLTDSYNLTQCSAYGVSPS